VQKVVLTINVINILENAYSVNLISNCLVLNVKTANGEITVNITAPLGVFRVYRKATVQNARMDIISQMGNV
jgi:hypothetical protein